MDTVQWPQDIMVKPVEEIATNTCPKERKVRPHKEQASNCPRCNSTNTKFCYYNNYSLSQPRYFCKTCRRYWTEGGSLRNIPVGGGSRKNRRSSSNNSISSKNLVAVPTPDQIPQNPNIIQDQAQDLNLGFSTITPHDFKTITELIQVPRFENQVKEFQNNPSSSTNSSALELLNGITNTSRGLMKSSFMSIPIIDPNTVYSSGFSLPEFKPSLNFSLDVLGGNYGNFQGVQETDGKLLFPYQDLNKQVTTNTEDADEQIRSDQIGDSTGYWNGMIGGGTGGSCELRWVDHSMRDFLGKNKRLT